MTRNEMCKLVQSVALECNDPESPPFIFAHSSLNDGTGTSYTSVRARHEWDKDTPEPQPNEKIPHIGLFMDLVRNALEEKGIHDNRYTVTFYDTDEPYDGGDNKMVRCFWSFYISFRFIPNKADPDTMATIQASLESGNWREGIEVGHEMYLKRAFPPGTEVKPKAAKNAKGYRWWYVTKYKTIRGMAPHRLLRSDGKFSSCPTCEMVEDVHGS